MCIFYLESAREMGVAKVTVTVSVTVMEMVGLSNKVQFYYIIMNFRRKPNT